MPAKDADYDYDLFTIGAGSGGVRASRVAAAYGARVAVTGASSNGVFRPADLEQALSQSFTAEAAAKVKII